MADETIVPGGSAAHNRPPASGAAAPLNYTLQGEIARGGMGSILRA